MSSDNALKNGWFRAFLLCQIPVFVFLAYFMISIPVQMAAQRRADLQRQEQERLAGRTPIPRAQCGTPMLVSFFAGGLIGVMLFVDCLLFQMLNGSGSEGPTRESVGGG